MKKALVLDGVIVEVVADGAEFPVAPAMQWVAAPDDVGVDTHEFDGQAVVVKPPPPPPPIPSRVTMRQARLALLGAGLLSTVNATIESMAGVQGEAARIEWEYALSVERDSPLVAGLSAALGLTAAQLDALFTTAAGL